MDKRDALIGYCGLYCGNCLYYQNTVKGVDYENGEAWTCRGCNSGETTPWCTECGLKACCRSKGIRTCIECGAYPCRELKAFIDDPQYPYHRDVPGMLKRLSEIGLVAWAEEMERQYTCPRCGERFTYFDRKCPRCDGTRE